jgi:bacteriocin-like protein
MSDISKKDAEELNESELDQVSGGLIAAKVKTTAVPIITSSVDESLFAPISEPAVEVPVEDMLRGKR